MKKVVFACVHNAGRSQMAAAFFNAFCDLAKMVAVSAGTEPAARVHPVVVDVMKEVGIDLSHATPHKLDESLCKEASLLVTMGCGENCPFVPGLKIMDWPLRDPNGQSVDEVRKIRDEIKTRVKELIDSFK